jgi:hypothetical protein
MDPGESKPAIPGLLEQGQVLAETSHPGGSTMSDESRKPIRERVTEKVAALSALYSLSHLTATGGGALRGSVHVANYKTVLEQLELEAMEAIAAAAAELRKPTVNDLVDRLWSSGPLTFRQIQASVMEAGVPAGEVETLLNRLHNAGLLQASSGPTPATDAVQQGAATLPPTKLLPNGDLEITRKLPVPTAEAPPTDADVTASYSQLVTGQGREWFNERAHTHGIDLLERIHCQF